MRLGKKNICEHLLRSNVLQITGAKALHQLLLIETFYESASTNHREISFAADLNGLRKTRESCVTLVFNDRARLDRTSMGRATIGIAKLRMLR